uniref:SNF-related serine/threonine-protein kinase n=1 Tax=Caenorhabditis tropicalis TaxID=1561998 RepID=A0A1I7T7D9_9PELO
MSNAPETGALRRKTSLHIRDTRIAGLYDLEKTIGQGHFAVVKLAKHVFTGEMVAVKIIDKTKMDEASTSQIMKEVRCMKLVQHANIVRLYEVLDTQTKIFLILELGDYDLHDFIIKHEKGVCESMAQQYFCQIMTAIDYCHQLHVVHRDLKPENVVFFEKLGMVKLTDFGFSNTYETGEQLSTSCGSLAYSAPEILLGDSYDAPAVDVWSLGVILYMLVCGRLPFQEANDSETLTKILDCKYSIPDALSDECRHLIQSMLVREPQKRASLDKIVSSSWVQAGDRGLSTAIPLIVRHHLPTSAHATIIEQMVAGGIASEENILRFLENDEYNSVTATYYLLAERVLASYREEQAREILSKHVDLEPSENTTVEPRGNVASRCRSRSNSWRARPCSILKEESEEELSSYLRSASRQSSRFYPLHDFVSSPRSASRCCSAQMSRQNSEEAVSLKSLEESRPATFFIPASSSTGGTVTIPTTPSSLINRFDDVLSPIDERREGSDSDIRRRMPSCRRSILNEINVVVDEGLSGGEEHALRKSSDSCLHAHQQLLRSASAKRLLRRSVVFAPRKMSTDANRRECLRHDVRGACRLIKWIAREDRANTKSLTVASNLVYGNTIVLSHQVARLFRDALRAKGVVAFSSFEDEEEDRRRRTREQMMGFDEESKTPTKRKRKSKAGVDDSLLVAVPGTPISTALRQTITMPDVFAVSRNDDIAVCDDLITPTNEDYEMFYGMLRSEDPEMEIPDYTFIDRLSQPNHENVMNETMDFQRPSGDFIQNQMETPRKSRPRPIDDLDDLEQLEPHPGLADILLYGRLPLLETERRRTSLEDEMESARAQGHDFETPQRLEPPRLPSERMELETDLVIPRSTRRMPKTPRLTPATLTQFPPDSKHRIPLVSFEEEKKGIPKYPNWIKGSKIGEMT